MDYIKKFKDFYKTDWNSNKYEIHHIDKNRSNNDIDNLVLLPKKLHHQFHFFYQSMIADEKISDFLDISISPYSANAFEKFASIRKDVVGFYKLLDNLQYLQGDNNDFEDCLRVFNKHLYNKYVTKESL